MDDRAKKDMTGIRNFFGAPDKPAKKEKSERKERMISPPSLHFKKPRIGFGAFLD